MYNQQEGQDTVRRINYPNMHTKTSENIQYIAVMTGCWQLNNLIRNFIRTYFGLSFIISGIFLLVHHKQSSGTLYLHTCQVRVTVGKEVFVVFATYFKR